MKIITAVVQPFMLTKVTHALEEIEGFPGMTVTDARGFGRRRAGLEATSPPLFKEFNPKARIEIIAPDEAVEAIVSAIARAAHTGRHGDGKIYVWSIEEVTRIQTGETGDTALS